MTITPDNIRHVFDFCADAGGLFWRISPIPKVKVGDRAGHHASNGYRNVVYRGKYYGEHRLIWLWVHGKWPDGEIDHINGARSDNKIENLRDVTVTQNNWNSRGKKSGGGLKGAYRHKRSGMWHSQISQNKKIHYLGFFKTEEDAHAAYVQAATRLHGEYARHL